MSVFEVLAKTEDEEQDRLTSTRAIIAAQERAKSRFGSFVALGECKCEDCMEDRKNEKTPRHSNVDARLALIDDEIRTLANEAAEEYDAADPEKVYLAATAVLGGGHKDGCECGFCANKGKLPGAKKDEDSDESDESEESESEESEESEESDDDDKEESKKPWESSVKTACGCGCSHEGCSCGPECKGDCHGEKKASTDLWQVTAEVETGDHYQSETLDLGSTTSEDGISDKGSPEIDLAKSGDEAGWFLDPIDVKSVRHPNDQQNAADEAKFDDPDFLRDLSSPTHTDADLTEAASPPDMNRTKTWTGTEGLADPVTSARVGKWTVVV